MIYEYKCEKCGKIIEKDYPMNDEHPDFIECDSCKGKAYRVFGASMIFPFYMHPDESPFDYNKRQKTVF